MMGIERFAYPRFATGLAADGLEVPGLLVAIGFLLLLVSDTQSTVFGRHVLGTNRADGTGRPLVDPRRTQTLH
jgi:hypothetical protein